MIDIAISLPRKIKNVDELIIDPLFTTECMLSGSRVKKYQDFVWTGSAISKKTAEGWFFYNFLKRAGWKVVFTGNFGSVGGSDFDEICSIVLEKIADAVGSFRPISNRSDGKTWGFEAYLQNYALKKAIKPCQSIWGSPIGSRKQKTSFISMDGDELGREAGNLCALESQYPDLFSKFDHKSKGIYAFDEKKCRNIIFRSVREALRGHAGAEAYLLHVVGGRTIRDTCQVLNISRSTCHRLVGEASAKVWRRMAESVDEHREINPS
jgi:hypothetical protein